MGHCDRSGVAVGAGAGTLGGIVCTPCLASPRSTTDFPTCCFCSVTVPGIVGDVGVVAVVIAGDVVVEEEEEAEEAEVVVLSTSMAWVSSLF